MKLGNFFDKNVLQKGFSTLLLVHSDMYINLQKFKASYQTNAVLFVQAKLSGGIIMFDLQYCSAQCMTCCNMCIHHDILYNSIYSDGLELIHVGTFLVYSYTLQTDRLY